MWSNFGVRTQTITYSKPIGGETMRCNPQQQQQQQPRIQVPVNTRTEAVAPPTWKDYGVSVQNISVRTYQEPTKDSPSPPPQQPQQPQHLQSPQRQQAGSPVGQARHHFKISAKLIEPNTIEYEYTVAEPSTNDWVGLYIYDRELSYESYIFTNGASSGHGTFTIKNSGYHDVRYMRGTNRAHFLARSEPVLIGPHVSLNVSGVETTMLCVKYDIEKVNITNAVHSSRWGVGLYPAGQRSNNKSAEFVECSRFPPGEVTLPTPLAPGRYDIRFFLQNTRAYSAMITVEVVNTDKLEALRNGSNITVTWKCRTKPFSEGNWVGLFSSANPKNAIKFKRVSEGSVSQDKSSGSLYFQIGDLGKGTYFLDFYTSGTQSFIGSFFTGLTNTIVPGMHAEITI